MIWLYEALLFAAIFISPISGDDTKCGESNMIIFQSPGNVSITGLMNTKEGEMCSSPLTSGLEQGAAAIWVVSVLNQHNYLPGLQIGLTLFDGCNNDDHIRKSFVQSLVFENCAKEEGINTIGTFASADIQQTLKPLSSSLNQTIRTILPIMNIPSLLTMAVELLHEMSFNTVHRVIADSHEVLNEFSQRMAVEGICIYDQVIMDDIHALNNEVLEPPEDTDNKLLTPGPPVIFVIASGRKIQNLFENNGPQISNITNLIWIIAPIDSGLDINKENLPNKTFVLAPVLPSAESLTPFFNSTDIIFDPFNHRQPTKSPVFLTIAASILKILEPLKEIQRKSCSDHNDTCAEVTEYLSNLTGGKIIDTGKSLSLTADDIKDVLTELMIPVDSEMFLYSVTEKYKKDDVAVFKIYDEDAQEVDPKLLIIKERRKRSIVRVGIEDIKRRGTVNVTTTTTEESTTLTSETKVKKEKHPCHDGSGNVSSNCGICLNFVKYLSKAAQEKQIVEEMIEINWRFETWVSVNASVGAIGLLCCIAVFIFVLVRICIGDILEGSPALSFFLLIALMISYSATLPFSFQTTGTKGDLTLSAIICDLRIAGPPLCYSILFSIMFSRSLMLAASDQDGGFMSHVNGYLQAVIIFFTCAVQFVMSAEYWLFNSFLYNPTASCQAMYSNHKFILLLSYNFFLLLLLASVIPFMIRSKRNYKEGTFYSIAILTILLVWGTWIPLFYFLPSSHQDASVLFGLTGTATAILICVFIPRTYLMATAIVRDRIVNTLPPLINSEHQFRSTQALYDSLNLAGKIGTNNPNFYTVNPTVDSSQGTPQIKPGEYYSNHGLKVPSPVRSRSPEPAYQEFDSPQASPNHVTRF